MPLGLAVQIFKFLISFKLEYGSISWGHTIYTYKHHRLLEAAQRSALQPFPYKNHQVLQKACINIEPCAIYTYLFFSYAYTLLYC